MARRCVWSRNLENEEAKVRYRAVKNTTTMGFNARKTNKQTYVYNKTSIKRNILTIKKNREVGRAKDLSAPLYVHFLVPFRQMPG